MYDDDAYAFLKTERPGTAHASPGQGAENGPWRNFSLTFAMGLRQGVNPITIHTTNPEMVTALTTVVPGAGAVDAG
ncbi:hypothetical protein ABZT27_35855 [Streptomyces sp. NPDC005389]|uniref:hypothetical protein n=1 Tax=Streptomyces sp. NPDC005389 TaxID=3157040 RepID=UPI0033A4AD7A